jgi:hypothetical protein
MQESSSSSFSSSPQLNLVSYSITSTCSSLFWSNTSPLLHLNLSLPPFFTPHPFYISWNHLVTMYSVVPIAAAPPPHSTHHIVPTIASGKYIIVPSLDTCTGGIGQACRVVALPAKAFHSHWRERGDATQPLATTQRELCTLLLLEPCP